ncbi:MAG TPA: helix-turn-helix domain-containing protein [Syntrophomonadaceae bacterium]|jgi:predicted transcriptional regulator|nr:helix-turn-helix domain-containing protein [Syntrophomonadaceae bacterium]
MEEIFELDLNAHEKLVYLYLTCTANSNMQASPSLSKIAKQCSISRSTAKRTINNLVEKGWIAKDTRHFQDGNYHSNQYTILREA